MDDDSQQVRELSERLQRIYEIMDQLNSDDAAFIAAELGIKVPTIQLQEVTV